MRFRALIWVVAGMVACGGAPEKPAASPRSTASHPSEKQRGKRDGRAKRKGKRRASARPEPAPLFPKRCARKKGECLPPPEWVNKLCDGIYPDLALHLFAPKTPWKRLYLVARAEPFNASGGMSLMGDPMRPGEEVIALRRRENGSTIQMGDTAGYDVFRWNGACATIHDGDFSAKEPRELRHASIDWRRLGLPLRLALEAQPEIGEVYETRHRMCKGKSMGIVSEDCAKYDVLLTDEVVRYVRSGGKVPKPTKVP